ncbi:oxacillin resistance protein FmtC [Pseudaestuariivita atlantica]|uniref:Oxacillin resistance protein FmtC n=1 Tax=Pseudaestuariivita atlantica TaxID=1317121 RepID=A0A0L1JSC5_9RHOB|nr:oxacillin resistance protein FmtC [Pseudaestuariivita atlantica]
MVEHPVVRGGIPLLIIAIAVFVLHRLSLEVNLADVRADLAAANRASLILAVLSTCAGFSGLAMYDVIAARALTGTTVPSRIAALTGAAGYALSNLLGFSYLTGTALRYRVYAGLGLDLATVLNLIAFSWGAFWLGLALTVGVLLVFHPVGLSGVLHVSTPVEIAAGVVLLGLLAVVLARFAFGRREIATSGHVFTLPTIGQSMALTAAAVVDVAGSALALYVLMPADLTQNFSLFFIVFVLSIALGVFSHAPGGIGVFEATLLTGLGAGGRSDALAALLLYRVIYTGLPFALTVLGISLVALKSRRDLLLSATGTMRRLVQPTAPLIASAVALAAGTVLLLSGNLPAVETRLELLRDFVPIGLVEASHLAASVAGMLLLVVARGLFRRLKSAWILAIVFLAVGLLASIAKGLDLEEAALMAGAILFLLLFRPAFHRVPHSAPLRLGWVWFASIVILLAALTWIGVFAYKHVEYRDALWWQVSWSGDASRFLRASLASAVVLSVLALNSLIGVRGTRHAAEPIPSCVRHLVSASPNAEANIALLGDKCFLIDPEERAYLAFGDTGSALVTQGEPVGEPEASRNLLWQFREMADREGKRFVFFGVSSTYVETFLDMGLAVVKYGEVGRIDLQSCTLDGPSMKDFRYARNRAAREGYTFEIVARDKVPAILDDLRRISQAWLRVKSGKEKGFTLGRFDDTYLSNFDIAILRAPGDSGEIVAFANILKGAQVELSVDLMRNRPGCANFVMDALFGELVLWGKAQGFEWFNLGAAPFSGTARHELASIWQKLGGLIYEHGDKFYHFEGLRSFKEKFHPVWSPNYVVCKGGVGIARALLDANELISGGLVGLVRKEP